MDPLVDNKIVDSSQYIYISQSGIADQLSGLGCEMSESKRYVFTSLYLSKDCKMRMPLNKVEFCATNCAEFNQSSSRTVALKL